MAICSWVDDIRRLDITLWLNLRLSNKNLSALCVIIGLANIYSYRPSSAAGCGGGGVKLLLHRLMPLPSIHATASAYPSFNIWRTRSIASPWQPQAQHRNLLYLKLRLGCLSPCIGHRALPRTTLIPNLWAISNISYLLLMMG